jgi:hypothetical protein
VKNKIRINVPVPEIPDKSLRALFEKRAVYTIQEPVIKEIQNAFVNHYGLVIKNGLLVPGCAFNLIGNEDKTFYYPFWKRTAIEYAVARWGRSKTTAIVIDRPCLLIHSKWFNYAFWINAYLPRLIMAEEEGILSKACLLLPERISKFPFVIETLKAFSVESIIIPDGIHVIAKHLYMPEVRPWTASFYPPLIKKTASRLKAEAEKRTIVSLTSSKRIYLTRKKRQIRCVENEEEISPILKEYGFSIFAFEDLSVWDQISIMSKAEIFTSLHGAGLSNLMFMPEKSWVIELINKTYATSEYTFPFWKLSYATGLNYQPVFCNTVGSNALKLASNGSVKGDETEYLVNRNVIVDSKTLEQTLDLVADSHC